MGNEIVQEKTINEAVVKKVAHLARLSLTDSEVALFTQELNTILERIQEIEKLDLSAVEPMAHAIQLTCPTRPDTPEKPWSMEQILRNAPAKEATAFSVPKILGE